MPFFLALASVLPPLHTCSQFTNEAYSASTFGPHLLTLCGQSYHCITGTYTHGYQKLYYCNDCPLLDPQKRGGNREFPLTDQKC